MVSINTTAKIKYFFYFLSIQKGFEELNQLIAIKISLNQCLLFLTIFY